jgi:FkbM family methyltransferase
MKAELYFNLYERQEIRFIRKYLRGASHVVELGSSLGVTSSHILDVLQPGGRLTCVEANPFLLDTLRATLSEAQRRTGREATVIHAAVWPHDEGSDSTVQLAVASSNLASRVDVLEGLELPIRNVAVPVVSLSTLVRGLTEYALVADIEGAEAALIAEEREALGRATRVIIELHPTQYLGRTVSVSDLISALVSEHRFRVLDRRFRVLALAR